MPTSLERNFQIATGVLIFLMSTQFLGYYPFMCALFATLLVKKYIYFNRELLIFFVFATGLTVIFMFTAPETSLDNIKPAVFSIFLLLSFYIAKNINEVALKIFAFLVCCELCLSCVMYYQQIYSFFHAYSGISSSFEGIWYHYKTAGLSLHSSQLALKTFIVLLINPFNVKFNLLAALVSGVVLITKSRTLALLSFVYLIQKFRMLSIFCALVLAGLIILNADLTLKFISMFFLNYTQLLTLDPTEFNAGRLYLWYQAISSINADNFLLGNYGEPVRLAFGEQNVRLHNEALQIIVDQGLLGFSLHLFLLKYFTSKPAMFIGFWSLTAPILFNVGTYTFIIVFYAHLIKK